VREENIKLEKETKRLNEKLVATYKKINDLEESLKTEKFGNTCVPYNTTLHYLQSQFYQNSNPRKSGNVLGAKEQSSFRTLHDPSKCLKDNSPYNMTSKSKDSKAVINSLIHSTRLK